MQGDRMPPPDPAFVPGAEKTVQGDPILHWRTMKVRPCEHRRVPLQQD